MLRLLAILCPPAAVALAGSTTEAAANVSFTLFLYLPGVVHALSVVRRYEIDRRNRAILNAIGRYYD